MKKTTQRKYTNHFLSFLILLVTFYSCTEYLDVDTDTDNPVNAPLNQLLTNIQANSIAPLNDFNFWSGDMLQTYTHQLTAREEQDQYGTKSDNTLLNNDWNNVYLGLTSH